MSKKLLFTFLSLLLFFSCAHQTKTAEKIPDWYYNYETPEGKYSGTGMGYCLFTNDENKCKLKAMENAADEVAMQMGVKVDTCVINQGPGKTKQFSIHTSNNQVVKAKIIKQYRSMEKDIFYVRILTL